MDIGERIYKLRKNAGLSQEQLAEEMEISRQSVTKWERNGSLPEIDKLIGLSEFFGVSIDYLLKGNSEYSVNENQDSGKQ